MKRTAALLLLAVAFVACDRADLGTQNEISAGNGVPTAGEQISADPTIDPGAPGGLPDERSLVVEGPIDPKSGQGAGQVLQAYAVLLEQGRLAEARRLWTEGGAGSGLSPEGFEEAFSKYAEIHAEIGAPGPIEGAAGSAYVEIPLRFYGAYQSGLPFNSAGTATLRRVNDVPGSTEEQRRWHIYRIDVQPPL